MKKVFLFIALFCMICALSAQEVLPVEIDTTICAGGTFLWDVDGNTYSDSGDYEAVIDNADGTSTTITLHLTVLPEVPLTEIYETICSGDTYELNGNIYSVTGDYRMTLENVNLCDSAVLLHLTVLTIEPTYITDTICFGDPYMWKDSVQYFARDTFDVDTVESVGFACDSVVYLQLTVLPISELTIDTTIIEGETFMWQGVDSLYAEHGTCVYVDTLVNALDCDSILTLNLQVLENNVIVHNLDVVEMCADDSVVQMMIEWEGYIDSLGLYFVRDTLDSIEIGLRDTIVAMPVDGNLSIPINSCVRAGVYGVNVTGYFRQQVLFEEHTTLKVLYPSSVLEQRWDDVICVLTSGHNGGYDFTAFQWYKDGNPLAGETGYYLNQKLERGAEYSALLTEQNGTQLMTCPIRIGYEQPEISVEPTLVHKRQPVRCQVAEVANMWVYDTMGKLQISNVLHPGRNDVQLPQQSGMYMLKVVLQTGEERAFKVLVL